MYTNSVCQISCNYIFVLTIPYLAVSNKIEYYTQGNRLQQCVIMWHVSLVYKVQPVTKYTLLTTIIMACICDSRWVFSWPQTIAESLFTLPIIPAMIYSACHRQILAIPCLASWFHTTGLDDSLYWNYINNIS